MMNRLLACIGFSAFLLGFGPTLDPVGQQAFAETIVVPEANAASLQSTLDSIEARRESGDRGALTVELPDGQYRLRQPLVLTPAAVGDGLTIKALTKHQAILTGSVELTTILDSPDRFWRFQVPSHVSLEAVPTLLLIDGQMRSAARFPDQGYLRIQETLPDRRSGFVFNSGDLPEELLTGQSLDQVELVLLHDWSTSRLAVDSIDPKTRVLQSVGPIGCIADHYAIDHFEKQPRYFLLGHPAFADQPGEWYFDKANNQFVVVGQPGSDRIPEVELPLANQLLTARPKLVAGKLLRNLRLEGLAFRGTQFSRPPGGFAGSQATMMERRAADGSRQAGPTASGGRIMLDASVHIENASNCQVLGCRFEAIGDTALQLGSRCKDSRVFRCVFEQIGGNGINLGEDSSRKVIRRPWYQAAPKQVSQNLLVEQCDVSRVGEVSAGAVAIWGGLTRGVQIVDNHIHDCPYTGVSLGWLWDDRESPAGENVVRNNHIEYVMQTLSDGGGVYTLGRQPGSYIIGNWITDIPINAGKAESNGMFLDQASMGFRIENNTIRRVRKSPIRFHRTLKNEVHGNRWELASDATPGIRYDNTPSENVLSSDNDVLEPQSSVFLIGNSLTWDTVPSKLDGNVRWHVDCGKSLRFIQENPAEPCVGSSRIWPVALKSAQFDVVVVQPHYGTTLQEDIVAIEEWMQMQPESVFVIHTGWARHAQMAAESGDDDAAGLMSHSRVYFDELLAQLRERHPAREFRRTKAMEYLTQIAADIEAGEAPWESIDQVYRDSIHMTIPEGRYLMHNAMRQALGQPLSTDGFEAIKTEERAYLDGLLKND